MNLCPQTDRTPIDTITYVVAILFLVLMLKALPLIFLVGSKCYRRELILGMFAPTFMSPEKEAPISLSSDLRHDNFQLNFAYRVFIQQQLTTLKDK
ncbi:hypothetical protein CEXT_537691 [Caerostris extrusa]|uniref:Uncharacterized protein n=1 Tax=Caerostris extrusa TaxID=172846 RepID=A0AAV4UE83_CAEEX|nr:hypothetical protein CEXT_537691 [Caerostris extrusa]